MSSGRAISKDVNGVFKLVSIQFPPIVADDKFLSIRPTAAEDETKKKRGQQNPEIQKTKYDGR